MAKNGQEYTALFEAPGGEPILKVYGDPLTGAEPWTVGIGHTGPDVRQGATWSEDQCLHAFANDYQIACGHAVRVIGADTWRGLNEVRRAVLADLAFNIGPNRMEGFKHMLAAIRHADWPTAAAELLDSAYAKQVKGRAVANALALKTGEWP